MFRLQFRIVFATIAFIAAVSCARKGETSAPGQAIMANNIAAQPLEPRPTDAVAQTKVTEQTTETTAPTTSSPETQIVIPPRDVETIKALKLDRLPEITIMIAVKSVSRTSKLIVDAGGRIDYDPNL